LTGSGKIDKDSIVNNNTYYTNPGVSMTHIINGAAGNIESHSTLDAGDKPLNITAVLDFEHYGFIKLKVFNATALSMSYIKGDDGSVRDEVTLLKRSSPTGSSSTASTSATGAASTAPSSSSIVAVNDASYMNISFVISLGGLIAFMASCL
jgi:acid phosphatase